jgi:hypothetical protein
MSTIKITDVVGASADLQIRDDSPLAKAKLTQLISTAKSLLADFDKPVDQTDIGTVALGVQLSTPSSLIDGIPDLTVSGGINCDLAVLTSADKVLFPSDGFAPTIPILVNQSWVGVTVDVNLGASLSAAADGFGIAVQAGAKLALTTFTLIEAAAPPLPLLKDAIVAGLEHFSIAVTAQSLRQQSPGTVNVCDASGSFTLTGSYEVPLSLSAFANANLPFNFSLSVAPSATVKIAGSLAVTGDLLVRSHKLSDVLLHLGVYKKKSSTLSASLVANFGVGVEAGGTEILGAVLNAALPAVDVSKTGIPADTAKALNGVIKDSLDRSIALGLNATCSASTTHEAAILYEIRLDQGDQGNTDLAVKSALRGDWTLLEALPNATAIRNIVVETKERKHALSLNLLGFYNSTSVTDYVSKCTVLRDDTGQLTIIDALQSSRIAATSTPYSADSNKLRLALAQDFITTASYAAVGSKLNLSLTLVQHFLDYSNSMSPQQLRNDVRLGSVLKLFPEGNFDADLSRNASFPHARVGASLKYDNAAVLSIFFSDPATLTARTQDEIEGVGRTAMAALIDPSVPVNAVRIAILKSDAAWSAMDDNGDTANFRFLPELQGLTANAVSDVGVDWVSIRWWASSISKVAPNLAKTLRIIDQVSPDKATANPDFMRERENLAAVLGAVARNTNAAFVDTWGPAVVSALSGQQNTVVMDVAWDSRAQHFERGPI